MKAVVVGDGMVLEVRNPPKWHPYQQKRRIADEQLVCVCLKVTIQLISSPCSLVTDRAS